MTARSLWSVRRLCWKPRPTFCSTQSTPSKRVQPSFKTSSRSVIGPSDVCRHLSLVLFYPVMIFLHNKTSIQTELLLAFRLDDFSFNRLSQFFCLHTPPVWNEIPKAILQGDFCLPNELKLTVETKCFTIDFFLSSLSVKWWQLSRFCVRHWRLLLTPTICSLLQEKLFLFGSELHSCLLSLLFIDLGWCGGISELKLEMLDFTWQNKMSSVSQSSSWLRSPH